MRFWRRPVEEPRRFEYVVRDCAQLRGPELEDRLNALARDGWEPTLIADRFMVLRRAAASSSPLTSERAG